MAEAADAEVSALSALVHYGDDGSDSDDSASEMDEEQSIIAQRLAAAMSEADADDAGSSRKRKAPQAPAVAAAASGSTEQGLPAFGLLGADGNSEDAEEMSLELGILAACLVPGNYR